jgi:hypothetical protein
VYDTNSIVPTLVEGLKTSLLRELLQPIGTIAPLMLGRPSAALQRSTRVPSFRAMLTPEYLQQPHHSWLVNEYGDLQRMSARALETTIDWLNSNFDTSKMTISGSKMSRWTWSHTHAGTWSHPLVKVKNVLHFGHVPGLEHLE